MKGLVENESEYHRPVLLDEVLDGLITDPLGTYVDCTLGGGGHSAGILERLGADGRLIALDRDPEAIEWSQKRFRQEPRIKIIKNRLSQITMAIGHTNIQGILMDLGVSSHQLNQDERGFTFRENAPLDMRMDRGAGITAEEYLRRKSEEDLVSIFSKYADFPKAKTLARAIKSLEGKFRGSGWLIKALELTYPQGIRNRPQMLARVFQALRIAVNEEEEEVVAGVRQAVSLLAKGGRLAVISFHSVEDRWVKQTLAEFEVSCICPKTFPVCTCGGNHRRLKKITRKPLVAGPQELKANPRARSAKLRISEKVLP